MPNWIRQPVAKTVTLAKRSNAGLPTLRKVARHPVDETEEVAEAGKNR